MNPLLLAAALAAVPVPPPPATAPAARGETRGWVTPATDDATRAVVYELRLLSLSSDLPAGVALNPGTTSLTDAQLRALMAAVQLDRRGGVLAAPRVTVTDGETARVHVGGTRVFTTGVEAGLKDGRVVVTPRLTTVDVGQRFEFTGRVAADGRTVTTRFRYADTRVGDTVMGVPLTVQQDGADGLRRIGVVVVEAPDVDTQTVEATVALTPGRHTVIPGPVRTEEVRETFETPVLSQIPYVSRLFTNVGVSRVPVRTYLVLSAVVLEDETRPDVPVAPAPRPAGR